MTASIGLIGAGEAGAAIAAGLHEEHDLEVLGFDARGDDAVVRRRAADAGMRLLPDLRSLAAGSDVVICLTSAKVAVPIATEIAPFLEQRHIYADWNSASPEMKRAVAEAVRDSGARSVDGAVMAAVPPARHRVPVLLSGEGAHDLMTALEGLGMQLEVLGAEPGQASAVKMFRSLLVKGLEALLLECAVGAQAYGVTHRVLESMNGTLPTEDWPGLADYLLRRTTVHGERRAEELRQVARTLEDIDVVPFLAEAGARRLQWYVDLGLTATSLPEDFDYDDALDTVQKARKSRG